MKTYGHLWQNLAEFLLDWEMSETKVVVEIKTLFVFRNCSSENSAIYEITWKNVEPDRPQMAV